MRVCLYVPFSSQIVSLARAVYSRASVLLLDDVLSAGESCSSSMILLTINCIVQLTPIPRAICIPSASKET